MSQPIFRNYFSRQQQGFWRFSAETRILACRTIDEGKDELSRLIGAFASEKVGIISDQCIRALPIFNRLINDEGATVALVGADCEQTAIEDAIRQMQENGVELILALGGGSVLDAAKLIAAAASNKNALDETICLNDLPRPPIPLIAIPTTFGTGSEVNIIGHLKNGSIKQSFRRDWMIPSIALLIAEVAIECPHRLRYLSALDAWLHAFESMTLKGEISPVQIALAKEAISIHQQNLRQYMDSPSQDAAGLIAAASCMSGMILNNARTGLIHALATPFAEKYKLTHSESLLPFIKPAIEYNWLKIKHWFEPAKLAGFFVDLDAQILFGTQAIMETWRFEILETDIDDMVDACLKDTVLLKENPMPLDAAVYKNLYRLSLTNWLQK